jgi:hypothetical protein
MPEKPKISILDHIRGLKILCICCSTSTLPQDSINNKNVQTKTNDEHFVFQTSEIKEI